MRFLSGAIGTVLFLVCATFAQLPEAEKSCEILARVNRVIITRAAHGVALEDLREDLSHQMQEQGKSETEIDLEFERRKPSVLDAMIEDLLFDQESDRLGLAPNAFVSECVGNPGLCWDLGYRIELNYLNAEEVDEHLSNDRAEYKRNHLSRRAQLFRQYVIIKDVLRPIFETITDKEQRDFYEEHREQFIVPETVSLSEVFIPFGEYSETYVEYSAIKLVAELRVGLDFEKAVKENTPATRDSFAMGGHLGDFRLTEIRPSIAGAISGLRPGEFTEPLRRDDGYSVIRLNKRLPQHVGTYAEVEWSVLHQIRLAKAEVARKDYVARLRECAEIVIFPAK